MKDETKRSAGADGADGADEKEKSDGRDGGIGRDGGTDGGELLSARAKVIAATEGERPKPRAGAFAIFCTDTARCSSYARLPCCLCCFR